MALGSYRPLLADGQVRALLLGTSVSGVSTGLTFALVLAVQDHHSIAAAGLVAGAQTIGDGVLIPARGRLIDQRGQHVLLPLAAVHAIFLIALAIGAASLPVIALCALSALSGMARAPLFASLRALWTDVTRDQAELDVAYSLHAVFNEALFVGGPLVVAAAATLISPAGALVLVGALEVAGAAIFTATTVSRSWRGGPRTAGALGALESAGMRTLALAALGSGSCSARRGGLGRVRT